MELQDAIGRRRMVRTFDHDRPVPPEEYEPIGAVAIGYDAETTKRDPGSRRRPLDSLVHCGTW
jgi:nitroreductase